MSDHTILVVGSINIDEIFHMSRLPSPGETVHGTEGLNVLGGKGANQAVAAALAGGRVHMVGAVGRSHGESLITQLNQYGVGTEGISTLENVSSGRAVVMVDDTGENAIVHVPGANHQIPDASVEVACAALQAGDVLVLQNEISATTSRRAAQLARAAGATVVWNAAPAPTRRDEIPQELDLLVVNQHELLQVAALMGITKSRPDQLIQDVSRVLGVDVVCTLGADGAMSLVNGEIYRGTSKPVVAVDTTGAGDTFVGYLVATLRHTDHRRMALPLGAGTLAVTRQGATHAIPTVSQVEQFLDTPTAERTSA